MGLDVEVFLMWGVSFDEKLYIELQNSYTMFTKTISFKNCVQKYQDKEIINYNLNPENIEIIGNSIFGDKFGDEFVKYLNHQISDIPKIKFYYNDDHIVLGFKVDNLCDTKAGSNVVTTSIVNIDKILKNAEKWDDYIKDVCDLLEMRWLQGNILVVTYA